MEEASCLLRLFFVVVVPFSITKSKSKLVFPSLVVKVVSRRKKKNDTIAIFRTLPNRGGDMFKKKIISFQFFDASIASEKGIKKLSLALLCFSKLERDVGRFLTAVPGRSSLRRPTRVHLAGFFRKQEKASSRRSFGLAPPWLRVLQSIRRPFSSFLFLSLHSLHSHVGRYVDETSTQITAKSVTTIQLAGGENAPISLPPTKLMKKWPKRKKNGWEERKKADKRDFRRLFNRIEQEREKRAKCVSGAASLVSWRLNGAS